MKAVIDPTGITDGCYGQRTRMIYPAEDDLSGGQLFKNFLLPPGDMSEFHCVSKGTIHCMDDTLQMPGTVLQGWW